MWFSVGKELCVCLGQRLFCNWLCCLLSEILKESLNCLSRCLVKNNEITLIYLKAYFSCFLLSISSLNKFWFHLNGFFLNIFFKDNFISLTINWIVLVFCLNILTLKFFIICLYLNFFLFKFHLNSEVSRWNFENFSLTSLLS